MVTKRASPRVVVMDNDDESSSPIPPTKRLSDSDSSDSSSESSSESNSSASSDYECLSSLNNNHDRPNRRNLRLKKFTRVISHGVAAKFQRVKFPRRYRKKETFDEAKADAFLNNRVMTPMQERFNAITMIPGMIYCVYFILAGCWITLASREDEQRLEEVGEHTEHNSDWTAEQDVTSGGGGLFGNNNNNTDEQGWWDSFGCIQSSLFPYLTALPPLPVIAAAVGILIHAPVSIMYHWVYAASGIGVKHWSRRLDHAFIHVASAFASYATSGRLDFFLVNVAFNMDCAYRQFESKVRPKRNLNRIASSVLLYLLPVLVYKQYLLFAQFFVMFATCGWLFVKYPLGGWSHGVFHLVLSFLPYLIMQVATRLESSQPQIELALKCAAVTRG